MSNDKCSVCKDVMFGNDDTCHDCQGQMCDGCSHIIQTRVNGVKLICTTCINQREENINENLNKNINER